MRVKALLLLWTQAGLATEVQGMLVRWDLNACLDILSTAHTGFAELNTAIVFGSTSLTPPENGAGEFSGPKTIQHFPGKTGFPSGASWKNSRVLQVNLCFKVHIQRTPHQISADLDILTSAHTGFADLNFLTSAHLTPQNGVSFSSNTPCIGPPY